MPSVGNSLQAAFALKQPDVNIGCLNATGFGDKMFPYKGGKKMDKILVAIANCFCIYGKTNAGMASIRGSYEAPVPKSVQQ